MTPSSSDKSVKRETLSKPIFSSHTPQSKQFPQAFFAADFSIEEGGALKEDSWRVGAKSFCTLPAPQVKQKRQTPPNEWAHAKPNHRTRLKTMACYPSPQQHLANRPR